jgi:hypothetical protein
VDLQTELPALINLVLRTSSASYAAALDFLTGKQAEQCSGACVPVVRKLLCVHSVFTNKLAMRLCFGACLSGVVEAHASQTCVRTPRCGLLSSWHSPLVCAACALLRLFSGFS